MDTSDLPTGLIEPGDPDYDEVPGETAEAAAVAPGHRGHRLRAQGPGAEALQVSYRRDRRRRCQAVADAFGYTGGTPSFQTEFGTVLDRNLTLAAAGVHNREKLELVDAGGGV